MQVRLFAIFKPIQHYIAFKKRLSNFVFTVINDISNLDFGIGPLSFFSDNVCHNESLPAGCKKPVRKLF